jgi:O-antigen/teichoic acid export membrane protein
VRVPLFLFAAVQAALLPGLADLAGRGNYAEFAQRLRRLLLLIGAVGVVATVGSAVAGTTLLRWFFGSNFHLGVGLLVQLAIANSVYMLGLVLGQALVALRHYTTVAVSWAAGVLTFVVVSSFGGSILQRAAHGFVAGTVLVVIVLAVRVTRAIQQREQVAPERIRLGGYPLFEE